MSSDSPPLNHFQRATSASKLRGQFYTPADLVRLIVQEVQPRPEDLILDPSCGDGGFLRGVLEYVAQHAGTADRQALAEVWVGRLVGLDTHPEAVQAARTALSGAFRELLGTEIPPERCRIYLADPLSGDTLPQLLERQGIWLPDAPGRLLVLGNPPYVEAKRLSRETKRDLEARYPGAVSGAPDLYLYFLHVCLGWMRPGDRLALVLPNKLLVNASARALRERLLDGGALDGLWLATDTRAFGAAGVYPVVLFAGDAGAREAIVRRLSNTTGTLQSSEPIAAPRDWFRATEARAIFAPPADPLARQALGRLLHAATRLGDVLQIRWSVSFHRAGLREQYVTRTQPVSVHARRFLGGGAFSGNGEVTRYRLEWSGWWIDYDDERLRAEGNPPPRLALFQQPKIAICQNARTLRAAYDDTGLVLKDTFLCGIPADGEHPLGRHPRALIGLLCSRAAHFFFSHVFFGGHVGGGYLHFLQSFLVDLPVGVWDEATAAEVAELVRRREDAANEMEWPKIEDQIERLVSEALGLTREEREAIDAWALTDTNWQRRERVRSTSRTATAP